MNYSYFVNLGSHWEPIFFDNLDSNFVYKLKKTKGRAPSSSRPERSLSKTKYKRQFV